MTVIEAAVGAPPLTMTTPYRGLMPYVEEDWRFFFGREHDCDVIAANLMASRLTLLYGPSGVGKTSVLRAGVAHHLREVVSRNRAHTREPEFAIVVFSAWRDDPVAGLLREVGNAVSEALDRPRESLPAVAERGLADSLGAWTDCLGGELLIVLDQFEEYFLYHGSEVGAASFASEWPVAVQRPTLRANFLISLREDTLARLDQFKGRIPKLFDNYLRVDLLEREAARAAIELPVAEYNRTRSSELQPITIEKDLVSAVLDEVASEAEQSRGIQRSLPTTDSAGRIDPSYLQVVMSRLWAEDIQADGTVLRRATLQDLGGARKIAGTYLDQTLSSLSPAHQDVAAAIFRYLVTPSGMKIAQGVPDLAEYASRSEAEVREVVLMLSGDMRILRSVPSPREFDQPRYEIYHDRLADAVLSWRARRLADQQREVTTQRIEEARVAAEQRIDAAQREADERVRRERIAVLTERRIVRSVILAVVTPVSALPLLLFVAILGGPLVLLGTTAVPTLLVHRWERPVSWRRAFAIGSIWTILTAVATGVGFGINTAVYAVGPNYNLTPRLPETALVGGIAAYLGGFVMLAVSGGLLMALLLRPVPRQPGAQPS